MGIHTSLLNIWSNHPSHELFFQRARATSSEITSVKESTTSKEIILLNHAGESMPFIVERMAALCASRWRHTTLVRYLPLRSLLKARRLLFMCAQVDARHEITVVNQAGGSIPLFIDPQGCGLVRSQLRFALYCSNVVP